MYRYLDIEDPAVKSHIKWICSACDYYMECSLDNFMYRPKKHPNGWRGCFCIVADSEYDTGDSLDKEDWDIVLCSKLKELGGPTMFEPDDEGWITTDMGFE